MKMKWAKYRKQAIPGPLLTGCQHSGHQCPATIKPGFINRSVRTYRPQLIPVYAKPTIPRRLTYQYGDNTQDGHLEVSQLSCQRAYRGFKVHRELLAHISGT